MELHYSNLVLLVGRLDQLHWPHVLVPCLSPVVSPTYDHDPYEDNNTPVHSLQGRLPGWWETDHDETNSQE